MTTPASTARTRRARLGVGLVLATAVLAGCTSGSSTTTPSATGATSGLSGELTILAAASLQPAFDELAARFAELQPGVDLRPITYDGSSTLVTQLVEGAPADVFAAADERTMTTVSDADLVAAGTLAVFTTNTLRIAVAPGNPLDVRTLADLTRPGLQVVLCAVEVPCGAAARAALDAAGVSVSPASEEQNVTAVVTKVAAGEADAGLVYASSIADSAGALDGVDFAGSDQVVSSYPIAVLAGAANPAAARAFVDLVRSPAGQDVLAAHGFGATPGTP
ncbi:molybdate ABC transporter substrate-binding protein [Pengzhenrongella phosphoraccumulans]|uniref:molybdate ABC transporter substrate-binding protein n=1 Tax=Pengzhenrongella phosphoraccumulans TaxID=3114394 RepID=UPI00388D3E74